MNEVLDNVESFDDAPEKPSIQKYWSYLLCFSLLSCLGVLFIPAIELKIVMLSISISLIIISLNKIISHDSELTQWYKENPDQIPDKMKKKKYRSSAKARTISIKK